MSVQKVYARHVGVKPESRLRIPLIKKCIRAALSMEGILMPCEVSVLITDDKTLCGINRKFRGIDSPTDVLSFPMQEFSPPGNLLYEQMHEIFNNGLLQLGDIVLSAERTKSQAIEFGHTIHRETAYLTVHAVLHLLGYDHVDEAEGKRLMRTREEKIIAELGIWD